MKIRGNTVGTPISPEQAVVKCKNLTEEQKAQARKNIGAGVAGAIHESSGEVYINTRGTADGIETSVIIDCDGNTSIGGELSFGDIDPESAKLLVKKAGGEAVQKQYELIENITLDEDVTSFVRTNEPDENGELNGPSYNFSAVRICIQAAANPNVGSSAQIILQMDGNKGDYMIYHQTNGAIATSERVTTLVARNDYGMVDYYVLAGSVSSPTNISSRPAYLIKPWKNVSEINLTTYPSGTILPAGSRIRIYAIRG
jgi:hypothetical protein